MATLLDTELLRTFVAIADAGSFAAAAERVHRTQSAVSMQMKRLEDSVGQPLFSREGRSMRLTAHGELLLAHARRILRAHREALETFNRNALQGHVTLGTPDDYADRHLPGILARFAESHPRVEVEIVCDATSRLLERLDAGALDIALISNVPRQPDAVAVHEEPVVWIGSPRHDVQRRDPLPLALFHPGCTYRQWALDALGGQGRDFRIAYTSVSLNGIRAAVQSGLAVGVVGLSSVPPGLRVLGEREGLPPLPRHETALKRGPEREGPLLDQLEAHIIDSFRSQPAAA